MRPATSSAESIADWQLVQTVYIFQSEIRIPHSEIFITSSLHHKRDQGPLSTWMTCLQLSAPKRIGEMLSIRENRQGIVFKVFVQPRSSKNMISGLHADSLKVKVTAPPVDGAANRMCIQFLAKCLSVSPSSLEITVGHNSRTKTILLKSKQAHSSAEDHPYLKQKIDQLVRSSVHASHRSKKNSKAI